MKMGVDLRQVVAAILTVTMFVMLGQMIKRDHFDSLEDKFPDGTGDADFQNDEVREKQLVSHVKKSAGLWKGDIQELKPCWLENSFDTVDQTEGFVSFSLINGPEYHVSQIADAVVVARFLGASIVIPDIRGTKPGDKRNFGDIYDVDKFIKSLDGVVPVVRDLPSHISMRSLAAVKVPNRVTEDYIANHVEPIYRAHGNIRLATYFPSINMKKTVRRSSADSVACLAMFGSLELQREIQEVVDSMVERLETLAEKSDGKFIAIDLRVDMLDKKGCRETSELGDKTCYNAEEVALFLRKIGFGKVSTIYVTSPRWDSSLDSLKDLFPNTYTKEFIMPEEKKLKFLKSEGSEFEKVIDFYLSTRSDVFVPAISGLFYANVAGKRIASGKAQIFVPAEIPDSAASASKFLSPYVSKKNHLAYSCYC